MRDDDVSTASSYLAVIDDLRKEIARLSSSLEELNQQSRAKQQAIADVERTITILELRVESSPQKRATSEGCSARTSSEPDPAVANLGLGDACIEVIARAGRGMRNSEILLALRSMGFPIDSKNPINNVGTCLHNRAQRKGDVRRVGKCWELVPKGAAEHAQPQTQEKESALAQ